MQILHNVLELGSSLLFILFDDPFLLSFIVHLQLCACLLVLFLDEFEVVVPGVVIVDVHAGVVPAIVFLNDSGLVVEVLHVFLCKSLHFLKGELLTC